MQLFTGLIVGARLVIARPGGHADPEYMADLLANYDVSFYNTGGPARASSATWPALIVGSAVQFPSLH